MNRQKIRWKGAGFIVVANMIGTGVFTSLGFQLLDVQNTWSILLLWSLGGIMALFGAFSYAELGTHLPKSGGEYHFLSELFHPFLGYLSGWVSLSVGFAAPVALAAMALAAYMASVAQIDPTVLAVGVILVISFAHSFSIRQSNLFQVITTSAKVLILLTIVGIGFVLTAPGPTSLDFSNSWQTEVFLPGFAIALVYVSYSYSGWNAAAYIVEEIESPGRDLPKALLWGAGLVTLIYVLLQVVFLRLAPTDLLAGKIEIGQVVAAHVFGPAGGVVISAIISVLLVSSISAMVWVGPRVSGAMSRDYALWKFLDVFNSTGVPVRAIWFQAVLSILLILTGTFEQVLLYSGFVLQIFSALTVAGVFVLRRRPRSPGAYRSPMFPFFQICYLLFSLWILIYLFIDKPTESLIGSGILIAGAGTYFLSRWMSGRSAL